jgi:MOSC domain-containing protein YiiM
VGFQDLKSAISNLQSEIAFLMSLGLDWREVSSVKLVSLNVARPRFVVYNGKTINTGIFKQPVSGPVQLSTLNLESDRQADLSVHGCAHNAVYGYPSEHYPEWCRELRGIDLSCCTFGENVTTTGLAEDELHVGDCSQIGSSIVMVR